MNFRDQARAIAHIYVKNRKEKTTE